MKRGLLFLFFAATAFSAEFFPRGTFDEFHAQWYSSYLIALHEQPIFPAQSAPVECYRFTWLRTFHRPVVIRVDVPKNSAAQITIKISDGAGGYEPGKLVRDERRDLSDKEMDQIRGLFEAHRFWQMPVDEKESGNDGAEWVIEAVRSGKYHVVRRWSPSAGSIHDLGMKFIELAIGGDLMPIY